MTFDEMFKVDASSGIITYRGIRSNICCICKNPFKPSDIMFPYDCDLNSNGTIYFNTDGLAHKTCLKNMEKYK